MSLPLVWAWCISICRSCRTFPRRRTTSLEDGAASGPRPRDRRCAAHGGSVVLVTHKLREALSVADEVTVLRRGRVVRRAVRTDVDEASLADAMFPERPASHGRSASPLPGAPVVVAQGVTVR